MDTWKAWVLEELQAAQADRRAGREGRARVRCRRAAGVILQEYFRRRGLPDPWGQNALYRMQFALTLPDLPAQAREALRHLTMRVDTQFRLPPGVDLLEDVRLLARVLLNEHLDMSSKRETDQNTSTA